MAVLNAHGSGWSDANMPANAVYVGRLVRYRRPGGGIRFARSKWHNPFKTVAEYRPRLMLQPDLLAALPELRGKDLVCWCAPERCHAAVLAELCRAHGDGPGGGRHPAQTAASSPTDPQGEKRAPKAPHT